MNEHILVIECPHCGNKSEYVAFDVVDSEENAYEKQLLLNGSLFEYKCSKCHTVLDMCFDMVYRDVEHNVLIYMVHCGDVDGVCTALRLNNSLNIRYGFDGVVEPWKRIVSCPHRLREKSLIFDLGLDDRVIEIIKIVCIGDAKHNIPDFYPYGATFNVKDGEYVIELIDDDKVITAKIPDGIYEHIQSDFADVLLNDDSYIIDDLWAMNVMGIDPDVDCDGDCDNCPHNCEHEDLDDDDNFDCDDCDDCEEDCESCTKNCCGDRDGDWSELDVDCEKDSNGVNPDNENDV